MAKKIRDGEEPGSQEQEAPAQTTEQKALADAIANAPPGVDPVAMADPNHAKFGG